MRIEILEDPYYKGSIAQSAITFKKWLKTNHPNVEVIIPNDKSQYDLHDYSLILPLVNLLNETTLQNYIAMVIEFSDFIFRGNLENETEQVKIDAIFHDEKSGIKKEFHFNGSSQALKESFKKFDLNKFMSEE